MYKKLLLPLLALIISFTAVSFSFAQTQGDVAPETPLVCTDLKNNLILTARDKNTKGEVTLLQEFLQAKDFLLADPTGYFGSLTKAAVIKFQQSVGLLQSGYVGPLTREAIKKQTCGEASFGPGAVACTMEYRSCPDGSAMPRNPNTCQWLENQCPTSVTTPAPTCGYKNPDGSPASVFGGTPLCTTSNVGAPAPNLPNVTCSCGTGPGNTATTSPVSGLTASVSTSANGPWSQNSEVCNTGRIYTQISNLNKANNPKICITRSGINGCTNFTSFRSLTDATDVWSGNTMVQSYVLGSTLTTNLHEVYIAYSSSNITKVGTFTPKSCPLNPVSTNPVSTTTQPTAPQCEYRNSSGGIAAVFGGTPLCTTSNVGAPAPNLPNVTCQCTGITAPTNTSPSSSILTAITQPNSLTVTFNANDGKGKCIDAWFLTYTKGNLERTDRMNFVSPGTQTGGYTPCSGQTLNVTFPEAGTYTMRLYSMNIGCTTNMYGNVGCGISPTVPATTMTVTVGSGSTAPNMSNVKVYVSNSPSGPWLLEGTANNVGTIYTKTTGLIKANSPKGCAQPVGSTKCLNLAEHRTPTTAEWGGTTDTTITQVTGGTVSDGTYETYLSYPGGSAVKVGRISVVTPTNTTQPSGPQCDYRNPDGSLASVFGGTPLCTTSNIGAPAPNLPNVKCQCSGGGSPTATTPSASSMSVYVSNSPSGPWTQNGTVINSGTIYTQARGVPKSLNPKGCATPAAYSSDCNDLNRHRSFTLSTDVWVNDTTIQTQVDGGIFPDGTYDSYISFPGGQAIKIGSFSIRAPQVRTEWSCSTFGGSVTPPNRQCTAGESVNVQGGTCYCREIVSMSPSSTQLADNSQPSVAGIAMNILENISKQVSTGFSLLNSLTGASSASADTSTSVVSSPKQCVTITRNLHRGDESSQTTALQKFLIEKGYLQEQATGFFGDLTIAAVKAFQKSQGLPETGMVYELTRSAISLQTCN